MDERSMDTIEIIITDDVPEDLFRTSNKKKNEMKRGNEFKFKTCLIGKVRKHREIYDTNCKLFSSTDAKEKAWQTIGMQLGREAEVCKNTWVNLRYKYQCHVRKLREFFRLGNKNQKLRPVMPFESDLLFLWRFIGDRSRWPSKSNSVKPKSTDTDEEDDVVILVEEAPIIIIDGDEPEVPHKSLDPKHLQTLLLTPEACTFIEALQAYPELYDTEHRYFNDYRRKGIIWNALANELKDKATKLMKLWIYLQTRYEWEINQNRVGPKGETELEKVLRFLKPHIAKNPNTVYKQSFYLKLSWYEPIEHFKNIFQLLVTMRKFPTIVSYADEDLLSSNVDKDYHSKWIEIGKLRGTSAGQCESTWLIMRYFYWELMSMRKHTYQLQDKWYFESIIGELYIHAGVRKEQLNGTPQTVDKSTYLNSYAISEKTPVTTNCKSVDNSATYNKNSVSTSVKTSGTKVVSKVMAPKRLNVSAQSTSIVQDKQPVINYGISASSKPSVSPLAPTPLPVDKPVSSDVEPLNNEATVFLRKQIIHFPDESQPNKLLSIPILPSTMLPPPPLRPLSSSEINELPVEKNPLPKSKSASSLLNENEIMVELIGTENGNQLVVHGPPLIEDYSMSMQTTASFIRDVMAIPSLHSSIQSPTNNFYWQYLARKFNMPAHICQTCWNFLVENFNHFNQIAPIEELMKPFKTQLDVWKTGTKLFWKFEALAVERGWLNYINALSQLMEEISMCPEIVETVFVQKGPLPIHIYSKYMHIPDIYEICNAFQNVFVAYMSDLERGINNKWPQTLWPVLSKLKFLLDKNYKRSEPFYYIIRNKINEELFFESQKSDTIIAPKDTVTSKNCKQTELNSQNAESFSGAVQPSFNPATMQNVGQTHSFSVFDVYPLLLCIQKHPQVYLGGSYWKRAEAWKEVATNMNASVHDCRVTFMRAVKEYHRYINCDPASRCRLNHKFFKPLSDIHRTVRSKKKLNVRTPTELNQSVTQGAQNTHEIIYPERFIIDINMVNSKAALSMKNWTYAVGNLSNASQVSMESALNTLFKKYRQLCA